MYVDDNDQISVASVVNNIDSADGDVENYSPDSSDIKANDDSNQRFSSWNYLQLLQQQQQQQQQMSLTALLLDQENPSPAYGEGSVNVGASNTIISGMLSTATSALSAVSQGSTVYEMDAYFDKGQSTCFIESSFEQTLLQPSAVNNSSVLLTDNGLQDVADNSFIFCNNFTAW